ncbi:MAG: HAD family acid phosphatase [Nocardioides sp.]|jgi:predicted secreted acid phosphatase
MKPRLLLPVAFVTAVVVGLPLPPAGAAPSPVVPIVVVGQPTTIVGVDQGLPPLVASAPYDAGAGFASSIEAYRASGDYQADQAAVARAARAFLDQWLRHRCSSSRDCNGKRAAAVFDIDDTLVDWYPTYASTRFAYVPDVMDAAQENCLTPAIVPVRAFMRRAQARGVAVFLISGRAETDRAVTAACLTTLGISGWKGMVLRQPGDASLTAEEFKSDARRRIERDGYRIITSIGDQLSDSTGGHVIRGFRLPNPMYFLP